MIRPWAAGGFFHRRRTKQYRIGNYDIALPLDHVLPSVQSDYPLYDRFLPVLCRYLDSDGWIIDVGANVGDTAVAIAQVCNNPILAIEGDETFAKFLNQNVTLLAEGRVRTVIALVGTDAVRGGLLRTHSTASRDPHRNGPSSTPLDDILRTSDIGRNVVTLLKVDTDGYDGDVIVSGLDTIKASEPILFWENEALTPEHTSSLNQCYRALAEIGYRHLWVFDNFGNLMFVECSFNTVIDLNTYVAAQRTRTIYYTDTLAVTDRHLECARQAIKHYISVSSAVQ